MKVELIAYTLDAEQKAKDIASIKVDLAAESEKTVNLILLNKAYWRLYQEISILTEKCYGFRIREVADSNG